MKSIVKAPHKVLTTPAETVTQFDKRLSQLITGMQKTLRATKNPKGVGLAAPQIGEGWRVFITRQNEKTPIRVFINPEIINRSDALTDGVPERTNKLEGCLSIPKLWGKVKRATTVTLRFQDQKGNSHEELFEGFMATIIQHETDHTNGILYTQRILEQKGKLYEAATDEEGKEILQEVKLR